MLEIVTSASVLWLPAVKVVYNRYICATVLSQVSLLLPAKLDATDLCGSIPFCRFLLFLLVLLCIVPLSVCHFRPVSLCS
jgi:hypothetical protein